MASGIYFRALRDGKWMNLEIEHLTEEEVKKYLQGRGDSWKDQLIMMLCSTIREIEDKKL